MNILCLMYVCILFIFLPDVVSDNPEIGNVRQSNAGIYRLMKVLIFGQDMNPGPFACRALKVQVMRVQGKVIIE